MLHYHTNSKYCKEAEYMYMLVLYILYIGIAKAIPPVEPRLLRFFVLLSLHVIHRGLDFISFISWGVLF